MARIDAVTPQYGPRDTSRQLKRGHYTIDTVTRSVYLDNQPIELTQKEFDLVLCIFRNAGRLLSRAHILQNVWGRNLTNTCTVDTHISRIRNKLKAQAGKTAGKLRAVYQHGYRLERSDELALIESDRPIPALLQWSFRRGLVRRLNVD
ncbi:MAG: winged helix-turn-helix domain-containing protein [Gammaproteobacteria bacterium]